MACIAVIATSKEPHVSPDVMAEWKEAIRKGDTTALDLLIDDLIKPCVDAEEKEPHASS